MKIIFLFSFIVPLLFSYYVYEPSYVFEYLNKNELDEYRYRVLKRSYALSFADAYAYNEIATNPPQPDFDNNYHQKVDIEKAIYGINQTDISAYQFYREMTKRISDLKDLNIEIRNNYKPFQILSDLYLACPIDFTIKKTNDIAELYCVFNNKYMNLFNQSLIEEIKVNMECPIASINGQDPFDFISNFGGNIKAGKNPHSTFTNKFNTHNWVNLATYPLNEDELKMEINFKNGKNINIKYLIVSKSEIVALNNTLFQQVEIPNEENKDDKGIEWEVTYADLFKCKVDHQNQVNLYFIESSQPHSTSYDDYEGQLFNCIDLFDQNNYPIVVIFGKNGRYHSNDLPKFFIELVSPLISMKYYRVVKIHEFSLEKIPIEYGEKNISYYKEPEDISYQYNQKLIEKKKTLKNKRKPTDILVFTDGNLVSAAALLMKNFQYYGAGITAGYFGNPNKNNVPFDSAQSTCELIEQKRFMVRSPRGYFKELIQRYNTTIDMPAIQYFYGDFDFKYPLEYSVTPVDERVGIYEYFKANTYQLFIDEAKRILDKYKTQCNPNNKKLVLVTNECDNKFENEFTHGGYECGDDGKWTNNCVPSYCDPGYVFSYKTKKCVSIMEKIDLSNMVVKHVIKYSEKSALDFWTIVPLIALIFILAVIIYNYAWKKTNKIVKKDDNGEELISIQE